jgi:hypothetical protein
MFDPLVKHAVDNVWCTPDQDRQVIIQPARITSTAGVLRKVRVMWEDITLPNNTGYFHVFSVGHVPPVLLNLPEAKNTWLRLSSIHTLKDIFIDVYNKEGRHWPLSLMWMRVMDNDNVILAAQINNNVAVDLVNDPIYFRTYSNAYFDSQRWVNSVNASLRPVIVSGGVVGVDFTTNGFRQRIAQIPSRTVGHTLIYHNGYLLTSDQQIGAVNGDTLEFVHDRSIKKVRTVDFLGLNSFNSILDSKQKHLIFPGDYTQTIEYFDDNEIYLLRDVSGNGTRLKGVYYHRNEEDAVRQLTHNAYSITDQYVNGYIADNPTVLVQASDVKVRLYIRHSGYERALVQENSRLQEMYKLPLEDIHEAMLGINALVTEWRAENLEQSVFIELMSSDSNDLDIETVADAYGYAATTQIASPTYHVPQGQGTGKFVNLPGQMQRCAVFGYNQQGRLLGQSNHLAGNIISVPAPALSVSRVELLDGTARSLGNTFFGYTQVVAPSSVHKTGYRCYACQIVGGVPNQEWVDVTDESYVTASVDGLTIDWDVVELGNQNLYPATRLGGNILWYEVPLNVSYPGYIEFSINALNYWKLPDVNASAQLVNLPVTIPYGTLDVFMGDTDGYDSLIENIDYYVQWPKVVITKKPPKKPADGLKVWVRAHGFCDSDLNRFEARETGFVRGGMLSDNQRHDVRNDRNIRIIAAGKMRLKTQVRFSEDDGSTAPLLPNGTPYSITDIIAPVEHYLDRETVSFYEQTREIDERVQDYITLIDPGNPAPEPNVITSLYQLYSPFVSKIIYDLQAGWLGTGELTGNYNNGDIDNWLTAFGTKALLPFEPTLNGIDLRYTAVHPHHEPNVMVLDINQYTFLERVIQIYLNGEIDLTAFVIVGTNP